MEERSFGAAGAGLGVGDAGTPRSEGAGESPGSARATGSGAATGGSDTANRLEGSGGSLGDTLQELEGRADQLLDDAAERLETAALRIDELAERVPQRGVGVKAGNLASSVADTLETVARYLRDNDMQTLQREVGRIAAERPLGTVLLAVGAGYVVGKVLR